MKEDFLLDSRRGIPLRHGADVVRFHERVVLAAQQVLEQDLHRVRQTRHAREAGTLQCGQAVNAKSLIADPEVKCGC